MPQPISFDKELTKKRVIQEIEEIEAEISSTMNHISEQGRSRLRELRIALETKPLVED